MHPAMAIAESLRGPSESRGYFLCGLRRFHGEPPLFPHWEYDVTAVPAYRGALMIISRFRSNFGKPSRAQRKSSRNASPMSSSHGRLCRFPVVYAAGRREFPYSGTERGSRALRTKSAPRYAKRFLLPEECGGSSSRKARRGFGNPRAWLPEGISSRTPHGMEGKEVRPFSGGSQGAAGINTRSKIPFRRSPPWRRRRAFWQAGFEESARDHDRVHAPNVFVKGI